MKLNKEKKRINYIKKESIRVTILLMIIKDSKFVKDSAIEVYRK